MRTQILALSGSLRAGSSNTALLRAAPILSTPEYAHGLPGAFKNALDWLVGHPDFAGRSSPS